MSYDTLPFAHEVWLKQSYGLPTWGTIKDRATVRYLRADLTCGECSHFQTLDCPHEVWHDEPLTGKPANSPACMAFVPEGKR